MKPVAADRMVRFLSGFRGGHGGCEEAPRNRCNLGPVIRNPKTVELHTYPVELTEEPCPKLLVRREKELGLQGKPKVVFQALFKDFQLLFLQDQAGVSKKVCLLTHPKLSSHSIPNNLQCR